MQKFYTNCIQSGKNILIREFDGNQRVNRKVQFKPTFYINSDKLKSKFKNINGQSVEPIEFDDIYEAKEWIASYENTPNFPIYGNTQHNYTWITENYPGQLSYDFKKLGVWSLDIEVEAENGFPKVEDAAERINLITFKNIQTQDIWSFALPFYGPEEQPYQTNRKNVHYEAFSSEEDMCAAFLNKWSEVQPDIITGWNIQWFDVPYLINRMYILFDENTVRKAFSPWGKIDGQSINFYGQEKPTFNIQGVSILDYYRLYRKYVMEPRENYKLGFIAETDLGIGKLDHEEYDTFSEFYKNNWPKYIDYNIRDVELVEALDDKWKLIELLLMVAYRAKVNYEDVLAQTRVWDMLIYNYLSERNMVIPAKEHHSKDHQYDGAYVKEPIPGLYRWVVSVDFESLYPKIMMILNMGFENKVYLGSNNTKLNITPTSMMNGIVQEKNYMDVCREQNVTLSTNGVCYSKNQKSVYADLLGQLFNLRLEYKTKLKESKIAGDKNGESKYDNAQKSIKILLNSMYGAAGSAFFRYYDLDIAEGVTHTGQFIIKFVERELNTYLNKALKTKNKTYVCYADTDSNYLTLDELIKAVMPDETNKAKIVKYIDKFTSEVLQPKITEIICCISNDYLNGIDAKLLKMNREVIADQAIWTSKKRYILNVLDSEGEKFGLNIPHPFCDKCNVEKKLVCKKHAEPKIHFKGSEIVKATNPKFCRDKMKKAVQIILDTGDNTTLIKFIDETKKEFNKLDPYDVSSPKSCNGLIQYADEKSIYGNKCPMHVRGALMYNQLIKKKELEKKYQSIQDGQKIRYIYLRKQNPTRENVIGFNGELPKEFGLHQYIDWELQFQKTLLDPLNIILKAIKWNSEQVANLEKWF